MSNNFHVYTHIFKKFESGHDVIQMPVSVGWYEGLKMVPHPLVSGKIDTWSKDLHFFLLELDALIRGDATKFEQKFPVYHDPFFRTTVHPMVAAYAAHKQGRRDDAIEHTGHILSPDWALACTRWLERRYDRKGARGKGKKNTDGGEKNREA
jgi:hypothetical protein